MCACGTDTYQLFNDLYKVFENVLKCSTFVMERCLE